jgi:hypothetical protein
MKDPLSCALDVVPPRLELVPDCVDAQTSNPRPVSVMLESVKDQAVAAFSLPFFDCDAETKSEPVITVGSVEAGTVHISARRLVPSYHANLTLYVRSDLEAANNAHYKVRGRCEISCDVEQPPLQREFAVGVLVNEDGSLTIDVPQIHAEMAAAITDFGSHSSTA